MAATILAVAGTAVLTVELTRRGGLTGDVVAARAEWTKYLAAGDFAKARDMLDQAAAEIRRYGADSRESREVQQLAREVALFADLPERSLEEFLQEVHAMSPQECAEYFHDKLRNPSVIVDAYVSPSPAPGASPAAFRLDNKLYIGTDTARLDLSEFRLFKLLSPGPSTRVLFGARIQSVERSPGSTDWIIHLDPDSGLLITSDVCLENVGWPVDEGTRAVLDVQNKRVLE